MRSKNVVGAQLFKLSNSGWDIPELRQMQDVQAEDSTFDDFLLEHEFPKLGRKAFLVNARRLEDAAPYSGEILLAFQDATNRNDE